jgi:hypothetical protein
MWDLIGEEECIASFLEMVKVLEEVEENGRIYSGGKVLALPIKTLIIGDKSFMWKVLKKGESMHM